MLCDGCRILAEETRRIETCRWQTGTTERGQYSRSAGDGNDRTAICDGCRDDTIPWIRDERCSRVADQGDGFTSGKSAEDMLCLCRLVVFVITDEGFADIKVRKQLLSLAGVFASDDLNFIAENAESPECDVFQISDRCCDKVEIAGQAICSVAFSR